MSVSGSVNGGMGLVKIAMVNHVATKNCAKCSNIDSDMLTNMPIQYDAFTGRIRYRDSITAANYVSFFYFHSRRLNKF